MKKDKETIILTHSNGDAPLAWACIYNYPVKLKELIDSGVDLDVQARDSGYTALMWSCVFGHHKCTKILIKAGANIDLIDGSEETALQIATKKEKDVCIQLLKKASKEKYKNLSSENI